MYRAEHRLKGGGRNMDVFREHWQFWLVFLVGFGGLIHNTARIYVRLGDILSALQRIEAKTGTDIPAE